MRGEGSMASMGGTYAGGMGGSVVDTGGTSGADMAGTRMGGMGGLKFGRPRMADVASVVGGMGGDCVTGVDPSGMFDDILARNRSALHRRRRKCLGAAFFSMSQMHWEAMLTAADDSVSDPSSFVDAFARRMSVGTEETSARLDAAIRDGVEVELPRGLGVCHGAG